LINKNNQLAPKIWIREAGAGSSNLLTPTKFKKFDLRKIAASLFGEHRMAMENCSVYIRRMRMPRLQGFYRWINAGLFTSLALCCGLNTALAQESQLFDRPSPGTDNWTTGPAVGEPIPEFAGKDQNGVIRSFDGIKGPNGALIIFYRSADW